jgi:hypothetical protein
MPFFFKHVPGVVLSAPAQVLPSPQLPTEQQTPSAQKPLAHSAEDPQALPRDSTFTQVPLLQ